MKQAPRSVDFAGYRIVIAGQTVVDRATVDVNSPGDYGADPLGDGTFRMVPSDDIVDSGERTRRLAARQGKRA